MGATVFTHQAQAQGTEAVVEQVLQDQLVLEVRRVLVVPGVLVLTQV